MATLLASAGAAGGCSLAAGWYIPVHAHDVRRARGRRGGGGGRRTQQRSSHGGGCIAASRPAAQRAARPAAPATGTPASAAAGAGEGAPRRSCQVAIPARLEGARSCIALSTQGPWAVVVCLHLYL
jgi:hypothetical protein